MTDYMTAIVAGSPASALAAVEGITTEILAVGAEAYQVTYGDAYRTIFLTSIALGVSGIICDLFAPNIDELMTDNVVDTLTRRNGNRTDGEEKRR